MIRTLTQPTPTHHVLDAAWRSLVVGVGYVLATIIGGLVVQLTGLPVGALAARADPTMALATTLLVGVVIGLALGPLAARLPIPLPGRVGVLFLLLFVLNVLINMIEARFFTTLSTTDLVAALVVSVVGSATLAVLLAVLFRPSSAASGLFPAIRATLRQRHWLAWVWRFALAGLLYLPTYFVFGMLIAPIVLPYYNNPALGLGLVVPGLDVILPLEVGRGLLYVLTLFPLVALLRGSRWSLALWVGLTIAVLGAWTTMLQASWLPLTLRLTHGLEITADAFVQGLTIAWLLGPGARDTEQHT